MEAKGKAVIVREDRLNEFKYPLTKMPAGTYIYRTAVLNDDEPNSGVLVLFQVYIASGELKFKAGLSPSLKDALKIVSHNAI